MTNTNAPWNKGLSGLEAGWDDARRQRASKAQKRRIKLRPKKYQTLLKKGPRPSTWITGPDKAVHKHYYRFLKAKNQARFWQQEWTLTWEDYLDLYKTMHGNWSRAKNHKNLCRIDTQDGWHIWNVQLMTRLTAMKRPTKGKVRARPQGLGSKKKGINWRRGGLAKTVVKKRTAPVSSDKPIDTDEYNQLKYRNHPSMKKKRGGYRGKPNHPNRNHKFS